MDLKRALRIVSVVVAGLALASMLGTEAPGGGGGPSTCPLNQNPQSTHFVWSGSTVNPYPDEPDDWYWDVDFLIRPTVFACSNTLTHVDVDHLAEAVISPGRIQAD